jgi:hypothetical protein
LDRAPKALGGSRHGKIADADWGERVDERIGLMLRALDAAIRPEQVNLPGYHFHALHGVHWWSIRVMGNRRITSG